MMGTEIFQIEASWPEKLMKTRVQFLSAPSVYIAKNCTELITVGTTFAILTFENQCETTQKFA